MPQQRAETVGDLPLKPSRFATGTAVAIALITLAYIPWMLLQARALWSNPSERTFPLILAGTVLLGWRACRRLRPLEPGDRLLSAALFMIAATVLGIGCFLYSTWLATVAALIGVLATSYSLGGRRLTAAIVPAWLLLAMLAPPPFDLDMRHLALLRDRLNGITSRLLDVLGVVHVMEGNLIQFGGTAFPVEPGYGGFDPLYSVLVCTLFFALWTRRSLPRTVLLLVAATCWVLVGNVAQTVAAVALYARWRVDWLGGGWHDLLGVVGLLVTLGLTFSTDQALACVAQWFGRTPRAADSHAASETPPACGFASARVPALRRNWLCSAQATVALGLICLLQFIVTGPLLTDAVAETFRAGNPLGRRFAPLAATSLPQRLGPFERHGFAFERRGKVDPAGAFSASWHYDYDGRPVIVALDYPLPGWGELTADMQNKGWILTRRVSRRDGPVAGELVEATYRHPAPGRNGYLVFCVFDREGRALESGSISGEMQRWRTSWSRSLHSGAVPWREARRDSVRFRVFVESESPLTQAERDQALAFFLRLVEQLPISSQGNQGGSQ